MISVVDYDDPLGGVARGGGVGSAGLVGVVGGEDAWDPLTQPEEFAEALGIDTPEDLSEVQQWVVGRAQRAAERHYRYQCPFCHKLFSDARWRRHKSSMRYKKAVRAARAAREEVPEPQLYADPAEMDEELRRWRRELQAREAQAEARIEAQCKRIAALNRRVAEARAAREGARASGRAARSAEKKLASAERELAEAEEALVRLERLVKR